tara:strand:+ start:825 stop:1028 length:204 start_codon:yes stop_codon:yes gene_type:complete
MGVMWRQGVLLVDDVGEETEVDRDDLLLEAHRVRHDTVARTCAMEMVNVINTVDDIIFGMIRQAVRG